MDTYGPTRRPGDEMIRPRRLGIILLFLAGVMFFVRVRQSVRSFRQAPLNARENMLATPSPNAQNPAAFPPPDSSGPPRDLPYKLGEGPYKVGEIKRIVLHDAQRNKDLSVHIYFPNAAGIFPVIVFSHGAGGSGDCCGELPRHWAGYGYVVLLPTHADSVTLRRENGEDIGFGKGMLEAVSSIVSDPGVLPNRVRDISFLLDSLDEIGRREQQLSGKMDRTRIGVSGHSLGSMTTQLVGGATFGLGSGSGRNFADGRVRAIEILSGGGRLRVGQNEHSWDNVRVPTLALTGSRDPGSVIAGPGFSGGQKQVYDFLPPGDKYSVHLEGANHMSFIGYGGSLQGPLSDGSDQAAIFSYVQMSTQAFWDAYLKGDASAREWLVSGSLAAYSHGDAKVSRK
jgi:predicted dienelactone hydrolase